MSFDTTRVHCTGCDYEFFEFYQPIELKCAIGSVTITYSRTRAWCYVCATIRDVERLPSLTRLKRELLCLRGKGFRALLHMLLPSNRARIRDKRNMIRWRESRSSPPRCLLCGSTNISDLDFRQVAGSISETRGFHHACGGRLVHDCNDKPGTHYFLCKATIWLDTEGKRIDGKSPLYLASDQKPFIF